MNLEIDLKKLKKEDYLSLAEYLVLQAIYVKPDIEIDYVTEKLLAHTEDYGYIRKIDDIYILEPKTIKLFENEIDEEAKEILTYFNKLKSDFKISNRKSLYSTYGAEIKARLIENKDSVEDIKKMLDYMFNEWGIKEADMKGYLRPQTLFNKKKYPNYMDKMEMSSNTEEESLFDRVEDD